MLSHWWVKKKLDEFRKTGDEMMILKISQLHQGPQNISISGYEPISRVLFRTQSDY